MELIPRGYFDIQRAIIKKEIDSINGCPASPGFLAISGHKGWAVCQMVVGRERKIDYFSFSADLLRDFIITTSGPGDRRAKVITNGYRHRLTGMEQVSLRLELGIKNGVRVFRATEIEAPKA
jgi:hypothetical protein